MDVADWLRELGLEQYEPAFRTNEINERVLPSLTAEDLKDPGVGLVGHRRRLLDAIAAVSAATVRSAASRDAPGPATRNQAHYSLGRNSDG
jgi:SAM (Sterile alpha motif) domain-containing protein